MKCKHINARLSQRVEVTSLLTRYADGMIVVDSEPGIASGTYKVECFECGLSSRYSESRLPKWAKELIEQAKYR